MLILDTPENCECCLCMGGITLACTVCRAKGKIIEDPFSKPWWCPLIPLNPEKEGK
nr:MAG TPA: hypothetical protein [Caudoviricetes sp.]